MIYRQSYSASSRNLIEVVHLMCTANPTAYANYSEINLLNITYKVL